MLELDVAFTAEEVLAYCARRGVVIRSARTLAGRPESRHWHLHRPGVAGTLELSEADGRVWLKVHPRRDGGWATAFAGEVKARSQQPG